MVVRKGRDGGRAGRVAGRAVGQAGVGGASAVRQDGGGGRNCGRAGDSGGLEDPGRSVGGLRAGGGWVWRAVGRGGARQAAGSRQAGRQTNSFKYIKIHMAW
ncbi:hypothetical protein DPMN_191737 [Dreissena polymorpha]|uniref:Uncharacterized protein n=1 Tax=Dreissena polymorpha TaxID=45954 RepID=A0A9D4BBV1_DREPO|nr:hypothetical protein DPMN_191737 [Dreissena polymorpha]